MAIEILDKGACKAAGFTTTNGLAPVTRAQGILTVIASGTDGQLDVDLVEAIAPTELLCLGGIFGDTAPLPPAGLKSVEFFHPDAVANPQRIRIQTFDVDGRNELPIWFAFFRMEGGQPTIIPAPEPPPLP